MTTAPASIVPVPTPANDTPKAHVVPKARPENVIPLLRFDVVPHWGWRATHGRFTFEIERMSADHDRERYRAFVRVKGTSMPIASRPFGARKNAQAYLQAELAKLEGGV
ncbi:MAG TPA: hypothetical protein PK857_00430 [Hyphomicrobium sp.]|nr:hypothetical protein [Hyphomicrobium sp.]HRO48794.1 hypothetical protein [Hyphomicrobium sp.]